MKNIIPHFLLFIILILLFSSFFYLYGKKIWQPYYEKYCHAQNIIVPCKEPQPCEETKPCEPCHLTHVGPLKPLVIEKKCPECPICPKVEKLTSRQKLNRHLADANFIVYPKSLTLIGLKHEKILEVWTKQDGRNIHLVSYPFTAFSGMLGPKLKEGDRQIPEGIYGISYLNPKSKFHLAMRVTYPNDFDKKMAKTEKRTNLGGDIMIHGSDRTIGCIPIGDNNIEELYFLAQKVGIQNIKVILSPVDFRQIKVNITKKNKHPWVKDLYSNITKEMAEYK